MWVFFVVVALKDGFGEAVVARDMPELVEFPSLESCQKRFLWLHKEVDVASHPVFGLVLQVEDVKKFSQALSIEISETTCRLHVSQP